MISRREATVERGANWFTPRQFVLLWARATFGLLCGTSALCAQPHTLDVSQYAHTSWTSQTGSFRGDIRSIAQTADGYLWLASSIGDLLRFDGVRFVEWKPPSQSALPPKRIFALLGSRDGSLWIAGIGLAELKANGELRRYPQVDGTWFVGGLFEDKDGGIWAGGAGPPQSSKLCRFDHGESQCFPADSVLGSQVAALHENRDGQLLCLTNMGVWKVRPGSPEKLAAISPALTLNSNLEEDAHGALVFSAGNDIKTVTAQGQVRRYPIAIIQAAALLKDSEDDLWFGTVKGIIHLHDSRTDTFTIVDGLSSNSVLCLFQDREKNVWVCTRGGLDKFTKPAVVGMTARQGLSSDFVTSVLTDRMGVLWVGTTTGFYRIENGRVIKSAVRLLSDYIESLLETSAGRMLVATGDSNGLVWFDRDGGRVSRLRAESGENVFGMAEGARGELWVLSRESGLLHLDRNGMLIESFAKKVIGLAFTALAYDRGRDGLWITSSLGDLGLFKGGKFVEQYGSGHGLGTGPIRDPQVDGNGGVWVGASVGLAHFTGGKIAVMNRKNGLPCDAVHWMRHGRDHNVWLYAECGLIAFSEEELSSWIAQPSRTITIARYLDNTDGASNIANTGWYTPQAALTKEGRIALAAAGLRVVDPGNLPHNSVPPPVHIEEITADEREIGGSGRISLPVGVRRLRMAFTAPSFVVPRKVRFRYQLEGYDHDWSEPIGSREITYTNLPPGDYRFRVIASNDTGLWNTTGDSRDMVIPPAFYQTIWFRCLVALAAAALLWGLYWWRLKQATAQVHTRLLAHMEERERIARELHDTLLQGFQGITLRIQGISKHMPVADRPRQLIEEVLDRADEVLRDARHRVRNLRQRATDANELGDRLRMCGEDLSKDHAATFTLAIVGEPRVLEPTVQDEAYRIMREALTNAFRHASASTIETEITYASRALRMRVRDDGVGIDKAVLLNGQPGHWGLTGMRERAHAIRAELHLWSKETAGTEVELVIPTSIAYPREELNAR